MGTGRCGRFCGLVLLAAAMLGAAAATGARCGEGGKLVLNSRTLLRVWMVERTPVVIGSDGKLKQPFTPRLHSRGSRKSLFKKHKIGEFQSPLPPESWRAPEFDDFQWQRQRAPVEKGASSTNRNLDELHSATRSSMICARARFLVDDPAAAGDLRLSVKYVGGVAVFINGKEVKRANLPEGELKPDTLAEKYPDDLYITADGKRMQHRTEDWSAAKRDEARFNRRYRRLSGVVIPASMLRKGLNVLALQLFRAPVHEKATTVTRVRYGGMGRTYGLWAYVGLTDLELVSSTGKGVRPNLGRHAPGVQVWNVASFDTLRLDSFGDPGSSPAPVRIDAVRGGAHSGRFVVSSNQAISGLKVEISELATEDGKAKLPPEAIELRHGSLANPKNTPRPQPYFDGLLPGVPKKVPLVKQVIGRHRQKLNGAIVPVWVTARPAKDAKPGLYSGKITVTAAGLEKTEIALRVQVHGWTLPDLADRRVKNLNVLSPYSVAAHYKVPFWSEEHFKLIEKSFRLMAEINARRVDLDLVPGERYNYALPLEWSMFRLVRKKPGKGYEHDFSVVEKIFDLTERTMGAPFALDVNCWGWDNSKSAKSKGSWMESTSRVPVRDPDTGKLSHVKNPPPGSEENFKFWKPILDDLGKRVEKRGWSKAMRIGHQAYCWPPNRKQVDIALRIWPGGAYSFTSHNGTLNGSFSGTKGRMPVTSSECVWTQGRVQHRGYRRLLAPGRDKSIWNSCSRNGHKDSSSLMTLLRKPEEMIMRGHDGLGFLLSDFLPIENPKRHRYYQRVPQCGGVLGYSTTSILAAGPAGPVATGRYEMFREGVQQCEAILYLERALKEKKISGDLGKRVDAYLDERSRVFMHASWPLDRQDLDRRLFELAAEVAAG